MKKNKNKRNKLNEDKSTNPLKKILILIIILIVIVIAVEVAGTYFKVSSLNDVNINLSPSFLSQTSFEQYVVFITLIIVLVVLIAFLIATNPKYKKFHYIKVRTKEKDISDRDIKRTLKIIDSLLGKLPSKEIKKFAKTKDANLYKQVLNEYGVK